MASKKVNVDFTGVESFNRPSEGQHVVKIVSAEMKQSQGGNDMIVVTFEVTKGSDKGARCIENYPLAENALWKLKGLLQAIGMKCDGKVRLDLDKLIGKVCIITVSEEEYEGRIRARVQECKKLAAVADEEDDEDQDEEDDSDDDEDDEDEEEEEAPKKKPTKKAPAKAAPKKKAPMNPPEDEDEDDDDDWDDEDEDDDEEEEPAPKKKPAKKAAPAKKTPAKKAPAKKKPEPEDDDDEDDDDDWDEE
jgi:hypothetical protein|nr:MAG TPA: Protein of unknown function (DUF669) [Caudoviricetes sp.]